jgi:transglutaminase/protease-like cytokinesis protein 3
VEAVYNFVVSELRYDNERAATVKSGYVPVLDNVLEEKKGICFDYAALMTGMLRSQGIPCKMVFGYTGGAYHAWISVWTEDTGWVDGVIFFDGVAWQRLDPTFASYDGQSDRIMRYIGDGTNYREKYFY